MGNPIKKRKANFRSREEYSGAFTALVMFILV